MEYRVSIKQLNATYVLDEDRVQFRFTTASQEEYRLYLTRVGVAQILSYGRQALVATLQEVHAPAQAQMIAEFKQQAVAQATNFKDNFEGGRSFPLQENFILARRAQVVKEGNLHNIGFSLANSQTLNLRLTDDLLAKLCALLQKMEQAARWGLDEPELVSLPRSASQEQPVPVQPNVLH